MTGLGLYIGPGLGGGAIAIIIGTIAFLLVGLYAFVYLPIKRKLKKKK